MKLTINNTDADRGGPYFRFARSSALCVSLLGAVAFAPSAQAVAIFDVLNNLTVTTAVISGDAAALDLNVQSDLFNDVFGDGTGAATSFVTVNGVEVASSSDTDPAGFGSVGGAFNLLGVGDAVGLTATANGVAGDTLPGPETFFADSLNALDFTVFNSGVTDATLRFSWDLEQQASASTDVFGETADALSLFNAFGSVFDAFGNDLGAAFPEVFSDLTTFAFDGSSDNTGLVMNSQFVDVTIKSGFGVSFVTAFADSFGSATGVTGIIVPEPGILSLLGIGLVAVGFAGRRRLSAVDA